MLCNRYDLSVPVDDQIDEIIAQAGRAHVVPPYEDPGLLEAVTDPRVLARARALLDDKDKDWRHRAILCLERIGYVRRDQETAQLLLAHAAKTNDKYEVMTTLEALASCTPPEPLQSKPLLELARRSEWQVWIPAVTCLHLARPEQVEPALLERLDASREGLVIVARELRYMTSAGSIEALERLLGHKAVDVRVVALDSLGERLGADVMPYARRLSTGTFDEQWWAEKWTARYGSATDVPFMAKRARALVTGARKRQYVPPELSYLVPFLVRHRDASQARRALDLLVHQAQRLPEDERRWLEAHPPQQV